MAAQTLAERVLARDPRAIARAITLVENEDGQGAALIGQIFARTGKAYLIGVTGPPGAGKSTLVDRLTAEYRKQGLPVSSSMVESLIKEINYRVKGTEKFWDNPEGAEAILQVRAALLSDDDRLSDYIASRPGSAFRQYADRECPQAA